MARILGPGASGDIDKPSDAKASTPGLPTSTGTTGTGTGSTVPVTGAGTETGTETGGGA